MRKSHIACGLILSAAFLACSESSETPGPANTAGTNGGNGGSSSGAAGSSAGTTSGGAGSGQGGDAGSIGAGGNNAMTDSGAAGAGGSAGAPVEGGAGDAAKSMMTFFITSTGSGATGGNLGGLAGADKKCQDLATAVGGGDHTWHAYLSVSAAAPGGAVVNAKDHIGPGPWVNQKGTVIAANLADLHTPATGATALGPNMLNTANGLDEKGGSVPGRAQSALPNEHDILTGSNADGTLSTGNTCGDWASTTGNSQVGHFDRMGTSATASAWSWNASHTSGCTEAGLKGTGGAGRIYCFAIN